MFLPVLVSFILHAEDAACGEKGSQNYSYGWRCCMKVLHVCVKARNDIQFQIIRSEDVYPVSMYRYYTNIESLWRTHQGSHISGQRWYFYESSSFSKVTNASRVCSKTVNKNDFYRSIPRKHFHSFRTATQDDVTNLYFVSTHRTRIYSTRQSRFW